VRPGVAPRHLLTTETGIVRTYREEDALYIDRTKVDLGECDDVYVIVYTKGAWGRDPEVPKAEKVAAEGYEHVLVTTLGNRGPTPPVSPHRFMHNVAGGNARWSLFFGTDIQKMAEEFVEQSKGEPIGTPIEESAGWRFCEWVIRSGPMSWKCAEGESELQTLRAAVDPDNGPLASVVEKLISTTEALVKTATDALPYWKDWAVVA